MSAHSSPALHCTQQMRRSCSRCSIQNPKSKIQNTAGRSSTKHDYTQSGIALLEMTAALFILVVGLFGAFNLYYVGLSKLRTLDEAAIAQQALQNELETLRSTPFASLAVGERPFVNIAPECAQLHLAETKVTISPGPDGIAGLKRADLSIRWITENGRRAERSVTTLIGETTP